MIGDERDQMYPYRLLVTRYRPGFSVELPRSVSSCLYLLFIHIPNKHWSNDEAHSPTSAQYLGPGQEIDRLCRVSISAVDPADPNSKIRVASDGKGVDTNVKHSMVGETCKEESLIALEPL